MAKPTIQQADLERYIDHLCDFGWAPCPACHIEEGIPRSGERPIEGDTIYVEMECPHCGSSWTVAYRANHVVEHLTNVTDKARSPLDNL